MSRSKGIVAPFLFLHLLPYLPLVASVSAVRVSSLLESGAESCAAEGRATRIDSLCLEPVGIDGSSDALAQRLFS
jgi:hypothetical protein